MQKKVLAAAIASALCAPIAAQAVEVKISGHVNRAIRFADDGFSSDTQHVDHGGSRTRLIWRGSEKLDGGNEAGIYVEIGMASNRSFALAMKDADGGDSFSGAASDIRHSALWLGGGWGTLWLGHTGNATYLAEAVDLSGMGAFMPNGSNLMNGPNAIRNSATGTAVTTLAAVSNTFNTGRQDVIKYVSPWLGPVQVEASHSNDDEFGIRGNAKASFGGGEFQAALGYQSAENRSGWDSLNAAASFKFSQGTSITSAYVERDRPSGMRDSRYWTLGLGHQFGNNRVALKYYDGKDMAVSGDDTAEYAIGFMHNIPKARVQLYATYHHTDYDHPSVSTEDMDLVMVGSRIFF